MCTKMGALVTNNELRRNWFVEKYILPKFKKL
jgi:hypothetical protein